MVGFDLHKRVSLVVKVGGGQVRFSEGLPLTWTRPSSMLTHSPGRPTTRLMYDFDWSTGQRKHHDVTAADRLEPVDELINEDPLLVYQPGHHAVPFDLHRLVQENNHDKGQQDRED